MYFAITRCFMKDYNLICYQLRHPRVLKQLRAEIDANIPYDVKVPSLEQIKLPNLVMVLKETMRLRSSGFGTFR
ncbi:uncharacterized protein RCO7_14356 [Rhynchosporium graminicola]|uniref:Uncharacterized protein n=1 Tax=Rhynchosporium graminicola TaxID=2792576 RepID=A0A1E1KAR4_9HELO|nr:uncharacterized protein RCO7_14356 [Rhynchosporium commune]